MIKIDLALDLLLRHGARHRRLELEERTVLEFDVGVGSLTLRIVELFFEPEQTKVELLSKH